MIYRTPSSMSEAEIRREMDDLGAKLGTAFREMGGDYDASRITILSGDTASKSAQVRDMNMRLDELSLSLKGFGVAPGTRRIIPEGGDGQYESKGSLGEAVAKSGALGERNGVDRLVPFSFESKALFDTTGWVPESQRDNRVQLSPQRAPAVIDLLPVIPIESASYPYMLETTYNNNAVEKAEAATFGEAVLALTEVDEPVRKIPVWLPLTDEVVADNRGARQYIDARLPAMLWQRADLQLVSGDGTAPNLSGFLDRPGRQTQVRGADPIFDALAKSLTKVRTVGFAEPDAFVVNATDWEEVLLTRTADGVYIMGSPAGPQATSIFGKRVVVTTAIAAGTALSGAFAQHSALIERQGVEILVSNSHDTDFIKGRLAVRATLRIGLAVYRESAFCEITL